MLSLAVNVKVHKLFPTLTWPECTYWTKQTLFTLQETEKLVAFTLGFVSHQVADITWHSLGIKQGFLTTMGDVNFFGSFLAAHPVGDIGGDMVASFEGDTSQLP